MSVEPAENLHTAFMQEALNEGVLAAAEGEVPVGAVVVRAGVILGRGRNQRERLQDPTAHAEVVALRAASASLGSWRLDGCSLYATLEPCAMCAGAAVLSRVRQVIYATADPKGGFLGTLGDLSHHPGLNHQFEVIRGVGESEASELLRRFFRDARRRDRSRPDRS